MKCRDGPLASGHQNFPATASQWRNHKNAQYFTCLPQPAVTQAHIRQGSHQGPHEEGKRSQNKRSYKNKLLYNSPSISPYLQVILHMKKNVAARATNAEQESGTPRTPASKKHPTALTYWSQPASQRLDQRDVCKNCSLITTSTVYNSFLHYTRVCNIYTLDYCGALSDVLDYLLALFRATANFFSFSDAFPHTTCILLKIFYLWK